MKGRKLVASLFLGIGLIGCTSFETAVTGGAVGAGIGQVTGGRNTKSTLTGAAIGTLVGLTAGAYLDQENRRQELLRRK